MSKFFQFEISSIEEAEKAMKNASYAAYVSGTITFLFALIAIFNGGSFYNGWIDSWILIDVVIIFVLGFLVSRRSKPASIILLTYFLLSQISMRLDTGNTGGIIFTLIFLFYYSLGVKGAFYYHKHSLLEEDS
ncbi:MAG: hypothetical protein RLN81_13325 [Balneolaceae bacterium]